MFLTVEDYRSVCDDYEFEQITQSPETREVAEAAALEQISSYLRSRYDIDRAFAASGSCRNAMLVQVAVNISLWLIHRGLCALFLKFQVLFRVPIRHTFRSFFSCFLLSV